MKILKSMLPIALLNLIALFFIMLRLPSKIPNHVNYLMEIDGFGSRWIIVILGFIPVLVSAGIYIYMCFSKVKNNFLRSEKARKILLPTIVAFLIIITWLPVLLALNYDGSEIINIPIDLIIMFPTGIFIIILSNFMGVIKYNPKYVALRIGIRTPWSIRSETVWKKTHRLGGYTGVAGGIVLCISSMLSFILDKKIISVIGLAIGMLLFAIIPLIYSYVIYKKENTK